MSEDRGADLGRLNSLTCAKWTWFEGDVLPAWVADMDFAPASVVTDAVRALVDRGDFGYNFAAQSQIPEAFAAWETSRHAWTPDVDSLRVLCDVMQSVELALWLHVEPGDGIVLFTPVYHPFFKAIESVGGRLVDCPLDPDGWRLDPERLESVVDEGTRVILTCNPHNPTGRVFDAEELAAIARVAEARDLLVISDEIWCDLVYPGAKHVPIAALGDGIARRTVTISAASKAFNLAGLRCAIAHFGSRPLLDALCALPGHITGAVSSLGAEATLAAWTEGGTWLGETLRALEARREQTLRFIAESGLDIAMNRAEATYLGWIDLTRTGLGDNPAEAIKERTGLVLSSGIDFGTEGSGYARLNMATSETILGDALDRLRAAVEAGPADAASVEA